ncbi:hypothetical protein NG895_14940 [Aeoliella sp. ICT_H6.2]|uniref:Uncharacterized protein n=1 Tax=Aeoliella straminimaris TaxID=2954799 RepID=A0A9X2JGX5_9BACT|nr:hypothetical protein [Aeoliella straminimaris]MCO6045206.1 hypothetical protein [Aeoliella straminimaris]
MAAAVGHTEGKSTICQLPSVQLSSVNLLIPNLREVCPTSVCWQKYEGAEEYITSADLRRCRHSVAESTADEPVAL